MPLVARPSGWTTRVELAWSRGDVAEHDLLALDDRALHGVEVRGLFARRGDVVPPDRVDDHRGGRGLGVGTELLWQRSGELAQRRLHFGRCRRRRPGDEEQRSRLGSSETAQVGATSTDQLPTSVAALP